VNSFFFQSVQKEHVKIGRISDSEGKAYVVFSHKPRPGHEGEP